MKKNNILSGRLALSMGALFFMEIGWAAAQQKAQDTVSNREIEEVVVLGSRSKPRTVTDSPVPVDVFNLEETATLVPQTNLNQLLNSIAPSFSSNVQTAVDGTDHIDPAQLRGLGPDQVLVLVNGKRRHNTALVNVNGSIGRGTVGTDLNAIPAFALSRIEVLRDGASAQYGSDAISGVMNLELKRNTGFSGQLNFGGNLTKAAKDHRSDWDGTTGQLDLNYGAKIGKQGGFVNLTFSTQFRDRTGRAGERTGQLYNAFNAINNRADEAGDNLYHHFTNINLLSPAESSNLVNLIHQYAQQVNYFDSAFQSQIQSANSISALQTLLGAEDVTDQEIQYLGRTRYDYNMKVGQTKSSNTQLFVNSEIPISDTWKFYAFGGYSYRHGKGGGFLRKPIQAVAFGGVYPNGFLPMIASDINDASLAAGFKGKWGEWNVDISNTYGQNSFDFEVMNSINPSMGFSSPTDFKAGGVRFLQNTFNLDFNKDFNAFEGLNLAFGAEQRHEGYKIKQGQPESYLTYDIDGKPDLSMTEPHLTDFFGAALPGGSQVFSGWKPENAVNKTRNSYAGYVDASIDFTDWLLVDAATRYEHYSDFGSTTNFKLASRIKLDETLNFRIAGSTGFRAPSIHQIYYNQTSTFFTQGEIVERGTFSNDSRIAELLGIPKLKQETSKSISAGFTYRIPALNLSFTADGYLIRVKNRIQFTDSFARPDGTNLSPVQLELQQIFDTENITGAVFFANAIDTETRGLDIVINHKYKTEGFSLNNDFALNLNKTRKVGNIHSSELLKEAGLEGTYFSERSRVFLEEALPRVKASLSNLFEINKLNIYLRNTYYGKVTGTDVITPPDVHPIHHARIITDLSVGYQINSNLDFSIGANNLLDVYPTKNLPQFSNDNQFVYATDTVQFGINGRHAFARLGFKF